MVGYDLIQGAIYGLLVAAPVGPIGILCIKRSIVQGRTSGIVSGLGAASADLIYGMIGALGISGLAAFLSGYKAWIQLIGACILIVIGFNMYRSSAATDHGERPRPTSLLRSYLSAFLMTLSNPMTILLFIGIISSAGLVAGHGSPVRIIALLVGIFLGSALWWVLLCTLSGSVRDRLRPSGMRWVNRISGVAIMALAIVSIFQSAPF